MTTPMRPLSAEELNGLRAINALDGLAKVPVEVRRRLALYGLIEETPKGWRLTRLGNDRLGATLSRDGSEKSS